MTRLEVYEIFGNPADLRIFLGQERAGGKYGVGFWRGPGHRYKILVESSPHFTKPEDAIAYIKKTLEEICEICTNDSADPNNPLTRIFGTIDQKANKDNVLNDDWINWIVKELTEKQYAHTFERSDHTNANSKSGRTVSKGRHAS